MYVNCNFPFPLRLVKKLLIIRYFGVAAITCIKFHQDLLAF